MARRLDRVRPGQDAVTHFLKEYGDRLYTGVVRDGNSLGWIVDAMEWIAYGEHLADELINHDYDPHASLAEHPLIDIILDQFARHGEPDEVYSGSLGTVEFTFKEAAEISGANSLASLEAKGVKTRITEGFITSKLGAEIFLDEDGLPFKGVALDILEGWGMPYAYLPKPLSVGANEKTIALAPLLVMKNAADTTVWPEYGYWVYWRLSKRSRLANVLKSPEVGTKDKVRTPLDELEERQANTNFLAKWACWNEEEDMVEEGTGDFTHRRLEPDVAFRGSTEGGNSSDTYMKFQVLVHGNLNIPEKWQTDKTKDKNAAELIALALAASDTQHYRGASLWLGVTNLFAQIIKIISSNNTDNSFALAVRYQNTYYQHWSDAAMLVFTHQVPLYRIVSGEDDDTMRVSGWAVSDDVTLLNGDRDFQQDGRAAADLLEEDLIHVCGFWGHPGEPKFVDNSFSPTDEIFGAVEWEMVANLWRELDKATDHILEFEEHVEKQKELSFPLGISLEIPERELIKFAEDLAKYEEELSRISAKYEYGRGNYSQPTNSHIQTHLLYAGNRGHDLKRYRPTTVDPKPEKWTQEVAMGFVKVGDDWQPGFKPDALAKYFANKVSKKKYQRPGFIFDLNGEERVFNGFMTHVDRTVWKMAVDRKYTVAKNMRGFQRTITDDAKPEKLPASQNRLWQSYRKLTIELHDATVAAYKLDLTAK